MGGGGRIVGEYGDHYPYTDPRYSPRRINCKQGVFADSNGNCTDPGEYHEWPTLNDIIGPIYNDHYKEDNTGCGFAGCARAIGGNYYASGPGSKPLTLGNPFGYATDIRTQYVANLRDANVILGTDEVTPLVTSGWRNPERNEAVGGVINSLHQWSKTIDLFPPTNDAVNFPYIYFSNDTDSSVATTWCHLAKAAFDESGDDGGVWEVLVENRRDGKPSTSIAPNNCYRYHNSPSLASCVSQVHQQMVACMEPDPTNQSRMTLCSPNHVHTAQITQ